MADTPPAGRTGLVTLMIHKAGLKKGVFWRGVISSVSLAFIRLAHEHRRAWRYTTR